MTSTTSRAPAAHRTGELLRGLGAALVLLLLVVGLPVVLATVAPLTVPRSLPDWGAVLARLTGPDDGALLRTGLVGVAWVAWGVFAASVTLEVGAVVRRRPTPRIPLLRLPQQGAAALVAAVVVGLGAAGAGGQADAAPPLAPTAATRPVSGTAPGARVPAHAVPAAVAAAATDRHDTHPTVVVRRHDTLWGLAERHLGSGLRFREIVQLNRGRTQPDGRRLTDPHWIYPGWVLRLPADAIGPGVRRHADPPVRSTPPPAALDVDRGPAVTVTPSPTVRDLDPPSPAVVMPSAAPVAASPARPAPVGDRPQAAAGPTPEVGELVDAADLAPMVALGLGAITVAGVVAEINRQRRTQQRSRRTGRRIASPAPDDAAAERLLRAVPAAEPARQVRAALRALARACAAAGRPVPRIAAVRAGPGAITLVLAEAEGSPPPPFEAAPDGAWLWAPEHGDGPDGDRTADHECSEEAADLADPCPALVSVGHDGPDLVLVNLEAAGTLRVVAAPEQAAPVVDALTVDLTTRARESAVSVAVVSDPAHAVARLAAAGGVPTVSDEEATDALATQAADVRAVLSHAQVADVASARSARVAEDTWVPEVAAGRVVSAEPEPWSGAAAVSAVPAAPDTGWALHPAQPPRWRLEPPGIELEPYRVDGRAVETLARLLASAPVATSPEEDFPQQCRRLAQRLAQVDVPDPAADPKAPRVRLLGPVDVQGADDDLVPGRVRRATELAAYLALHPGVGRHELDEVMWPGRRVSRSTRNPFVSRARLWLGRDPSGAPYLPLVADDCGYRLLASVGCDWYDFVRLARDGLAGAEPDLDALGAALALVRGRPFLGVDPESYSWADADVQDLVAAIVDVAHLRSVAALAAGHPGAATRSAARGLSAEPASETLHRDVIRAAAARGDDAAVRRAVARMRGSLEALGLGEDLMPETLELIAEVGLGQ